MTTDCIHCGQNPGEVCRGCYERARQEAYAWAGERVGLQHASVLHLHRQVADLSERVVLAEQERDRLREQVASLREAARAITDACWQPLLAYPLPEDDRSYLATGHICLGHIRALAKALEETTP